MIKKLRLPVGVEDFREIREKNLYYVDKTRLIEQIFDDFAKVTLFTRPRRFGKTLNMSMLRNFFAIGTDQSLFEGLYIAQNKQLCEQHLGKHPVIFLSLKNIEGLSFEQAQYRFVELIAWEAARFHFLLNSDKLTDNDKKAYHALIELRDGLFVMDEKQLASSLQLLSQLLTKYYGKKAVILIDEYDVPLDKAFEHGYYKEMVALIRGIFGQALKTNEYLEFAVLTGCLRISKESIFTGLNNFRVLTITDARFDEQFGFTNAEVQELLQYYGLEAHLAEMREWYDGYRFGNADVYCPWDVINHVDRLRGEPGARPEAYWINTSGNALVKRFIDKANKTTRDEIERLVAGEAIEKLVRLELTYGELEDSIENLWSVLFTTGYLTQCGRTEEGAYKLIIPNKEVCEVYKQQIQEWFKKKIFSNTEQLTSFWQAVETGDPAAIEKYLNRTLSNSISVFDTKAQDGVKENAYHTLLVGLLAGNADWLVRSNVEAGEGFADIIIETDDPDAGIVVEVKYTKEMSGLEQACSKAIAQIKEKRYSEYLTNDCRTDVLLYGMAFCRKRCKVVVEKLS